MPLAGTAVDTPAAVILEAVILNAVEVSSLAHKAVDGRGAAADGPVADIRAVVTLVEDIPGADLFLP